MGGDRGSGGTGEGGDGSGSGGKGSLMPSPYPRGPAPTAAGRRRARRRRRSGAARGRTARARPASPAGRPKTGRHSTVCRSGIGQGSPARRRHRAEEQHRGRAQRGAQVGDAGVAADQQGGARDERRELGQVELAGGAALGGQPARPSPPAATSARSSGPPVSTTVSPEALQRGGQARPAARRPAPGARGRAGVEHRTGPRELDGVRARAGSQVGKGTHQGYLLQTVIAVDPSSQQVWGIAAQEPFLRQRAPVGETSHQRSKRKEKESLVWQRQVQQIGPAPQGCEVIHVGDRGSDMFFFLRECQQQGCGFLVQGATQSPNRSTG